MDALKSLIAHIPDWVKRLDELSGQIEQRQLDLARIAQAAEAAEAAAAAAAAAAGTAPPPAGAGRTKSIRNKGSTESLRPRDEPAAHPDPSPQTEAQQCPPPTTGAPASREASPAAPGAAKATADPQPPSSPGGESGTHSAQERETRALAQARVRATLRKRNRSDSLLSAEGAAPKYRTRSMIIVYYDSYVQSFFEELVKFVSASRNLMRKAKMAAKVAQIKRMAELEMPDEEEEEPSASGGAPLEASQLEPDAPLEAIPAREDGGAVDDELPAMLKYTSARRMPTVARGVGVLATGRPTYRRAGSRSGFGGMIGADQAPDVYDALDKALEYVQSTCEHAAHQFLRDGDCNEEITNVRQRLGETKDLADKEMERIKAEDPEALKLAEEPPKTRSFRPQSMRKDFTTSSSSGVKLGPPTTELEVDEGIDDMDEEVPKLVYKSTRMMR